MEYYTVAEFSSIVHCAHDRAMNDSLNQLVPTERGKPNYKLGKTIQANKDGYHDPVEDVFAALLVFLAHEDLFKGAPSNPK